VIAGQATFCFLVHDIWSLLVDPKSKTSIGLLCETTQQRGICLFLHDMQQVGGILLSRVACHECKENVLAPHSTRASINKPLEAKHASNILLLFELKDVGPVFSFSPNCLHAIKEEKKC